MLARSTTIDHPFSSRITTPLLIPSFSSKGLGFDENGQSEINDLLETCMRFLTDSMLISAYDLHYEHLEFPQNAVTDIVFVDSGGYEASDFRDLSETIVSPAQREPWDQASLKEVYDRWPDHIPAAFVSYDDYHVRMPLAEQITAAREFLEPYRNQLKVFLIKPETRDQKYVQINNIIAQAIELSWFDIIGITEKELGASFIERMNNIAKLRMAFDDAGSRSPLHVFGSLDPISVSLYFVAGAEAFDGLTWIRFGYHLDTAMYRSNSGLLSIGVDWRDDLIKMATLQNNLIYLNDLRSRLERFLIEGDFMALQPHELFLKEAYELLKARNRRVA